ncbi:MAG: 23S rRNA (pseudouridine(1915)-N(3))-methyltransferase RlmH [Desulfovibrio sp.]|nr:23S rRNA (pseudouridine(1915)-N(3))-methyltransferase RlmH [Desulfovibrio sp.]
MAGRPLRLLVIGKLKHHFTQEGCALYQTRLERWRPLEIKELKDADSALPLEKRVKQEAERILRVLTPDQTGIVLDEKGQMLSSKKLAALLEEYDRQAKTPCFIIGGPYGLDESVRARAKHLLSLSPMTFPHDLARLLLLEQLYRAESIRRNIPYHH